MNVKIVSLLSKHVVGENKMNYWNDVKVTNKVKVKVKTDVLAGRGTTRSSESRLSTFRLLRDPDVQKNA